MNTRKYVVIDETGLHARPAAVFVKAMAALPSAVRVTVGDRSANGKSILEVLALGVVRGGVIVIDFGEAEEGSILRAEAELAGIVRGE